MVAFGRPFMLTARVRKPNQSVAAGPNTAVKSRFSLRDADSATWLLYSGDDA